MQDYLIDTNHINPMYRAEEKVSKKIRTLPHERKWCISNIVLAELHAGQKLGNGDAGEFQKLMSFLDSPPFLRLDQFDSPSDLPEKFGEIVYRISQIQSMTRGETIEAFLGRHNVQTNDVWLVAEAWSHQLVVVTNDRMTLIRQAVENTGDVRFDNWL